MFYFQSYPINILKNLIGGDMDFSYNERKVGTWVDGKSIYQKSFDIPYQSEGYHDVSDLNIENVVLLFGIIKVRSSGDFMQIPYANTSTIGFWYYKSNKRVMIQVNSGDWLGDVVGTICYTKTTD